MVASSQVCFLGFRADDGSPPTDGNLLPSALLVPLPCSVVHRSEAGPEYFFSTPGFSALSLYATMFGNFDRNFLESQNGLGNAVFGLFTIIGTFLFANLLIAMFGSTFQRIAESSQQARSTACNPYISFVALSHNLNFGTALAHCDCRSGR
jgi:hypothetical protein